MPSITPTPAPDHVRIFDTTLRDGEQSPGISLDEHEKLEIASRLAALDVDVIEAGFPAASPGDFAAVEAIARLVSGPTIAALARTNLSDIDAAASALAPAASARLHVFIATSDIHLAKKLQMTRPQALAAAREGVAHARSLCDDVEFSAEDAFRSDPDFLLEVCQAALEEGATTINIPDTVGFALPDRYGALIARVRVELTGEFTISTHCHNDLGLAVANSLAGVANGARQIECAINGIGERAGNAALEEVVMAIHLHGASMPSAPGGVATGVRTVELSRASQVVSRLTGYVVPPNKAIVGENAFAHEAGIHQHGVLKDPRTYEVIDARSVGRQAAQIVLGKHSGRHAIAQSLEELGYPVHGEALTRVFERFKELADRKARVSDADLIAIVADELTSVPTPRFELESISFASGTGQAPTSTVAVLDTHDPLRAAFTATASGDGMIDAAFAALCSATGIEAALIDFHVAAVSGGADALGDVSIRVEADDTLVSGHAVATDVSEAAARAFLVALNKLAARPH